MNQIVLMGRLTRDPELRHTQSNIAVASFTLAVDRGYSKDKAEKQTDFIDIVTWRGTAEFVSKYFIKGQMAAVSGRLQIRDWQDKEGNKRRSAEVVAENVYFTGSKKESGGGTGGYAPYGDSDAPPATGEFSGQPLGGSDFAELGDDDDELPF